jgi:ribosomal protein L37AE/L43A
VKNQLVSRPLDFYICAYCTSAPVNLVHRAISEKSYKCDKCGLTMSDRKLELAHVVRSLAEQ